jgi:hypothetical protein
MYNVSVIDLFNGFSKFVALHYALSHRDDTEYWRALNDREFKDPVSNDPYTPYATKSGAFYNMVYRYMEEWVHNYGIGGITYIATGMNVKMMNDARIQNMSFKWKRDYLAEIDAVNKVWEVKKARWAKAAESAPTLFSYLNETFYN